MTPPRNPSLSAPGYARNGIRFGYARAWPSGPDLPSQCAKIYCAGVEQFNCWEDSSPGRRSRWRGLMRAVCGGDTIVVVAIDALGRNLAEITDTVHAIRSCGIGLRILSNGIHADKWPDTTAIALLAALSDYGLRQRAGLTERRLCRASADGAASDRRTKLTNDMLNAAILRINAGESQVEIAAGLGVHRNTLSRAMERRRRALRYGKATKV